MKEQLMVLFLWIKYSLNRKVLRPWVKAKWVAALRSGRYTQGFGSLRSTVKGEIQHCCLGVLCELYDPQAPSWKVKTGLLPTRVMSWASITSANVDIMGLGNNSLAHYNDTGRSFSEIADIIESRF